MKDETENKLKIERKKWKTVLAFFLYKKNSDGDFEEQPALKKAPHKNRKQAQLSAVSLPGKNLSFYSAS